MHVLGGGASLVVCSETSFQCSVYDLMTILLNDPRNVEKLANVIHQSSTLVNNGVGWYID